MADDPLLFERRGRIGILTINRTDRKNSLSRGLLDAFEAMQARVGSEQDLRALVLTGAGDVFCAGADLKERAGMSENDVRTQLGRYQNALGWLETSPLPVVAAINGAALGGGLELALLCDLRVAARSAVLGLPETRLGIIPGAGGTQRLPRVVGLARAKRMILLGEQVDAKEALRIGLVHETAEDATLLEETLRFIRPIEEGAPIAQAAALAALDLALELPLDQGLQRERREYEKCLQSEDRKEALLAFGEKRAPRFQGR